MQTPTFRKTRNEPGFHGSTWNVYHPESRKLIGQVRVAYAPGAGSGASAWTGGWRYKLTNEEEFGILRKFASRKAAGIFAVRKWNEQQETPQDEAAATKQDALGYPKTKHCPRGHGSFTFEDAITEKAVKTCRTCGAVLVDHAPELGRHTDLQGLPPMPATHHSLLPKLVSALQAAQHAFLSGPPGTGKSHLASQAAEALGLPFNYIACESSMTRSTLMGFIDGNGTYHRTPLRDAVEFGGVFLIDEVDNGNPSLIAALNGAMSNGLAAFPDGMVAVHPDFRVVATGNTWGTGPTAEFVGRLRVDPATLDRFVRLYVDLDEALEFELASQVTDGDAFLTQAAVEAVRQVRKRVESEDVRIILGPRATMQVASLMVRGWSAQDALMTTAVGTLDQRRAEDLIGGVK